MGLDGRGRLAAKLVDTMTRRGLLLFAAMCLIWGIPYLLIRIAVSEISPAMLVFTRTAVGALILMPVVMARGGLRGLGAKWVPLLLFAAVEIGGPWFFMSSAEQHISSSLAGLLVSAVPLIGVAIAPGSMSMTSIPQDLSSRRSASFMAASAYLLM